MIEATDIAQVNPSFPTPPRVSGGLPFFGHALEFGTRQEVLLRRGHAEHGNLFTIDLLGKPCAVLVGPEEHEFFFKETDKNLDMEEPYGFLAAIFGKIAFLGTHETYKLHRPVLHSLFGRQQMAAYLELMSRIIQNWLNGLEDEVEVNITHEMAELVKEVAGRCFLGDEVHERLTAQGFWRHYAVLSASLDPIFYKLPLPKFIRRDRSKKKIREILKPLIEERRRSPKEDGFQLLLDQPDSASKLLPDEIIASFFSAMLFAGHETTAGQAAWSILQLIHHPAHRQVVEKEIAQVLGSADRVDHVALRGLRYTNAAVQETGRMRPSAETLFRAVTREVQLDGFTIPRNWFVMTSTAAAHFQPEYFQNPYAYDPSRFLERGEGKGFGLLTFGGGQHKCTGMNFATAEMVVILAMLFRDFDLELITPYESIAVNRSGSSRPSDAWIRLRRKTGESKQGA